MITSPSLICTLGIYFSMLEKGEHTLDVYSELSSLKKSNEKLTAQVKSVLNVISTFLDKKDAKIEKDHPEINSNFFVL